MKKWLIGLLFAGTYSSAGIAVLPPQDSSTSTTANAPNTSSIPVNPFKETGIPKEIMQLPVAQRQELMKKAQNLNNAELQAVARSFAQQLDPNTSPVTATEPPPSGKPATPVHPAYKAKNRSLEELKRDQAFNNMLEDVMPLSPDQITRMHKYYDLTLQAKATPPSAPPSPQFTSTVVNLEPGSSAPVIRLAAGFVTTILFVDSTGAPWPITAYSIGDPQNFYVQWNQKDNTLFIQSLKVYAHANMAVRLWGLDTPVVLTLVSGQKTVDFRVDLQVGGRGPEAKPPVVTDTAFNAQVNPLLMNILDGVPPKGSIKLKVSGGYADAWLYDNKVYFRTKLTVLSPAWLSTVSSPDGTHVYEMMLTPYIVATQDGKTVDIKLSGL